MITCSFVSYNGNGADTSAECVEPIYKIRDTRQLPSVAGACVCVSVSARLEVPAQYVDITVVSSFVCSLILWLSRFRLRTPSLAPPQKHHISPYDLLALHLKRCSISTYTFHALELEVYQRVMPMLISKPKKRHTHTHHYVI